MKHGRLRWYEPAELSDEGRRLYDLIVEGPRAQGAQAFALTDEIGRLNGPFNALLATPEIGTAIAELGRTIRYAGRLSGRVREIAILECAVFHRSEFEWYAHARIAPGVGLTDAEIDALREGRDAPSFAAEETLVRSLARELMRRDLSESWYAEAERSLDAGLLVELVALVGYYELLALSLRVFRTPLPDGAAPVFGPTAGPPTH